MRTPAAVVHPGVFLSDELRERGWSQVTFAEIIDLSPQYVNDVISCRRDVSPAMAVRIGAAFGTSPEFWLNLDRDWKLAHVVVETEAIKRRAADAERGAR